MSARRFQPSNGPKNFITPGPFPTPPTAGPPALPNGNGWRRDQRYASFAERYVIERAATFRVGHEKEDAWAACLDARAVFLHIEATSKHLDFESPASP